MSVVTDKAQDIADIIAEDPVTVTVYRRNAGEANESEVAEFEARIDFTSVRVGIEAMSAMGTFTRQNYVMVYVTTGPDLRKGDEVWAEWSDGRAGTFRVLSFESFSWKKEAIMEKTM